MNFLPICWRASRGVTKAAGSLQNKKLISYSREMSEFMTSRVWKRIVPLLPGRQGNVQPYLALLARMVQVET